MNNHKKTNSVNRKEILDIVSSHWPCNVSQIMKLMGLETGKESKDKVTNNLLSYHVKVLAQNDKIKTKKIGRSRVVWPADIEKLRFLQEFMGGL